jgi:hypothetical protein
VVKDKRQKKSKQERKEINKKEDKLERMMSRWVKAGI